MAADKDIEVGAAAAVLSELEYFHVERIEKGATEGFSQLTKWFHFAVN